MANYGLVKADGTKKLAYFRADRWNDGIKRHTLYTCCGTFSNFWGMTSGYRSGVDGTPSGSFDALIGAAADPHLFNWCPITYPISGPLSSDSLGSPPDNGAVSSISLGKSISAGITELTNQIQNTTGTFAMVGMCQGSAIISGVMEQLQSGSLTSRYGDCIAAVAFSNPCRQAGKTFPDGSDPGGAGIFPTGTNSSNLGWARNGNTPSWWWEMAAPNDPFATAPTDIAGGGDLVRSIVNSALNQVLPVNGMPFLDSVFAALSGKGTLWQNSIETVSSSGSALTPALAWASLQSSLKPSPAVLYSVLKPLTFPSDTDTTIQALCPSGLGLTSSSTYTDIALAYINARGATVAPR